MIQNGNGNLRLLKNLRFNFATTSPNLDKVVYRKSSKAFYLLHKNQPQLILEFLSENLN